ncbi:thiamine phosphate synthase [Nocardioides insulae]|uniref:thiamine phosphate synthase n=1 Tax=Nocardioides insulae TaxID=394734 RepID=UPI000A024064|nr:thiamine phosphate synthase [Nocardioides insulae]
MRPESAAPPPPLPRVCALVSAADEIALLPAFARAGVGMVQVRAKALPDREVLELVARVRRALAGTRTLVLVNDRVDLALAAGADGVHLGIDDLPVPLARQIAPDLLIGATCRDRRQVEQAARDGADYAGFGPVWATASKQGLPDPLGTAAVGSATGPLPLLAIGGVDAPRARQARAAGAHGVAVLGALWRAPDPVAAAKELVAAVA